MAPLFEVRMELCDGRVQYRPSLEAGDDNSFLGLVENLLSDTFAAAACMPRLLEGKLSYKVSPRRAAPPSSARGGQGCPIPWAGPRELCPSLQTTLEEHVDLSRMREEVVSLVVSAMTEGEEYSAGFQEQAHLWLEDPTEFLQHFLTLGRVPSSEELELQLEEPRARGPPSLQQFQQEVWGGCLGCSGCPGGHRVPGEVLGDRGGAGRGL